MVFDSISSNIDEVLSFNPSANVFVFEDFNIRHKDWLTYSGGTDRSGKSATIFLQRPYSTFLLRSQFPTQSPTFLLRSQTVILIVQLFWICFFLLIRVFVLQWLSLHWEILIMLLSQVPLTFRQSHNRMPHFIA